jgi:pimeloyl-ACP methyl ester carboxylesterase
VTQVICVADKRRVAVECWGSPNGMPVFLLHGTPGSRNGPRPRSSVLYRLGVRLISYDRPGYGLSDPFPGRTVADAAADVATIAAELELDGFGVVGRSGGGPHALACAALLGDRVTGVACLVGLAPSDAKGLKWYDGMASSNIEEFQSVPESAAAGEEIGDGPDALATRKRLAMQANLIREDPEYLLSQLTPELAASDKRIVSDIAMKALLADTHAEAVRQGESGWIDDDIALRSPWQFELSEIKVPVLLWHGEVDVFSPASHTRWLAAQIDDSVAVVQPHASHFSAVEILPRVLTWIKDPGKLRRAAQ